jgi:hypothetical protein
LDEKVAELRENGFEPHFSPELSHLYRGMWVEIPFLPVQTKKEFHVFRKIKLSAEMDRFDGEKMALLWVKHIDGVLVFPKLPAQLRDYH